MFEEELEFFRATRARTLDFIGRLAQEQLDFRPAAGKWSIGEIADHVRRAEEFNRGDITRLIEMQKSGQRAVVKQTLSVVNISIFSIPRPIFALFETPLNFAGMFLPTQFRDIATLSRFVKLKNPDNVTPSPCQSKDALRKQLTQAFQVTSRLLRDNPDLDYRRMTFVQPLLGAMNVLEMIHWMALHEQRHQAQICEVMMSTGFPCAEMATDLSDRG